MFLMHLKILKNSDLEKIVCACAKISRSLKDGFERLNMCKDYKEFNNKVISSGHYSVVEHAVLTLEIKGSRLGTRTIVDSRLVSPTERSQRFTKVNEYYTPNFHNNITSDYDKYMKFIVKRYKELLNDIKSSKHDNKDIKHISRENARYILPQSMFTLIDLTVNIRELNHIANKMLNSELDEELEIGKGLENIINELCPSLRIKENLPKMKINLDIKDLNKSLKNKNVILLSYSNEDIVLDLLKRRLKEELVKDKDLVKKYLEKYNFNPYREFEFAEYTFMVKLSQSAYRQLLRHRLTSKIILSEGISHGFYIPEIFYELNLDTKFKEAIREGESLYNKIDDVNRLYLVSNAHYLVALVKMNLRELYHISQLRECFNAQEEIRNIVKKMSDLVIDVHPKIAGYLGPRCLYSSCPEGVNNCKKFEQVKEEYSYRIKR